MTTQTDERTNWGRWGDDDERGALNLLTPERVRAGAAAVTTGKVYSLGIPIQSSGVPLLDYRGTPMRLTLLNESDDGRYAMMGCAEGTGTHEDVLVLASHTTSHMSSRSSALRRSGRSRHSRVTLPSCCTARSFIGSVRVVDRGGSRTASVGARVRARATGAR